MQDTSRLEHVGLAVEDPQAVAALYEKLLGVRPYKAEAVEEQGVRTHFIGAGAAKLELLEALGPESPAARFLEKRGEGVHHLAFEVEDIQAALRHVSGLGFTPLSETPRPGADGKLIFFLHPRDTHGVLVEFCQSVPVPLEATRVLRGDVALAAYALGAPANPPLLLLHGAAGCTHLETAALARRLAPHFHVLALDFSGHGASAPAPVPFSLERFAGDARAVLDHFDVAEACLFGFSMGGAVALQMAVEAPQRVRRLAAHGTNVFWDAAQVKAAAARFDAEAAQQNRALVSELEAAHGDWQALFRKTTAFLRTLPAQHHEEKLSRVQAPALVSAVSDDDLFPLEAPIRLHRALPDSRLALLPGTRHAFQHVDLDAFVPLLLKHFGR